MQRIASAILLLALILSGASLPAKAQANKTLTIFAAASLTDAFGELATAFKVANPGVDILFNFGSSTTLATQLKEGASADIFASANPKQMNVVRDAKRTAGEPKVFARNRLILIVPADNPAQITSLKDLDKPGIKLVVAAPNVPVRDYTNAMLDLLAKAPEYGEDYKSAVLKNIVSEEDNVRQVVAKVALGEADAGIVYASDVTPDVASKILALPVPDEYNTIATYPIAVTDNSANPDLANAFVDFVLSDTGQDILVKWGFVSIRPPALPATAQPTAEATVEAAATSTK